VVSWAGDNPYYLLTVDAVLEGRGYQRIDLDESGWATTYAEWMRTPGEWHLIRKQDDGVALSVKVFEGEQPYYTSRVFGSNKTGDRLVRSWGIGKKQLDGTMLRLWILDSGQICGGDDVDVFGVDALHRQ
jgi:hypothetical protein